MQRNSRLYILLLFIFVFSGAAGLIYQSIWTQYLGLFLGHAAYAQSLVLILFMGGMGLGAWFASRYSEQVARPLLVYAGIEFVLGVFGLAFDPMYRASTEFVYANIFVDAGPVTIGLTRWGLASLLILPQCILLGATFPLMSAGCLRHMPEEGGRVLGGLYFSNSIGAACGALVATFLLLPTVGLPGTLLTAGLLNILVALAAWMPGKEVLPGRTGQPGYEAGMAPAVVLVTAAITGLTSFVYEVVWVRMLALVVGSTVHAFELMLAAFISGLAVGGLYLKSRADKYPNPLKSVAWIQVFMGLAALASVWLYSYAFGWVSTLIAVLAKTETGYSLFNFATALICLAIMFPAAFFAGMTLPLLTLALLRRGGERVIGQVYAANTLGCIFGVLLSVHVLMPMLGVKFALWMAAAFDLFLGVTLFLYRRQDASRWRHAIPAFTVAVSALLCTALFVQFDPLRLASSVFRSGLERLDPETKMLYYRDGKTATVAMFEAPTGRYRSVSTNSKVDAAATLDAAKDITADEYTMAMAALIPLFYLPDASTVGVIGFGSGITTHTLLASKGIKRVDTVEIEPSMVEASRNFEHVSARAYSDPRSNIVIDDAKAYFSKNSERYDVIVSEPSNPWVSGVATLFTEEFYRFVPRHLNDNGLFVQWVQLYEITPELISTVVRAMEPHFEDVKAYLSNSGDMIIVAKPKGRLPQLDGRALADGDFRAAAERVGISSTADLELYELFDRVGFAAFGQMFPTNANSDFFPILQLNAPRTRFQKLSADALVSLQNSPLPVLEVAGQYVPGKIVALSPKLSQQLPRVRALKEAYELRGEMLGTNKKLSFETSANLLSAVAVVKDFANRCENDAQALMWVASATNVANGTIPFLSPEELKGVWIDPPWAQGCKAPVMAASEGRDLFAALARRDWAGVDAAAEKLLAAPDMDKVKSLKRHLMATRLVAQYGLGNDAKLGALANEMGADPAALSFHDKWLLSMSLLRTAKH